MPLLETARTGFELLLSIGAGSDLLYLLRWDWWRINAWSEIAAMAVSFVVAIGFFVAGRMGSVFPPNTALLVTVFATTSNTAPVLRWPELCQNVSKTPAESGGSLTTLENSNNP